MCSRSLCLKKISLLWCHIGPIWQYYTTSSPWQHSQPVFFNATFKNIYNVQLSINASKKLKLNPKDSVALLYVPSIHPSIFSAGCFSVVTGWMQSPFHYRAIIIHTPYLTSYAGSWTVGGSQRTLREATQTQREHVNSTRQGWNRSTLVLRSSANYCATISPPLHSFRIEN